MKKLNLLLTISLVSLFISLLLILIGNKNVYCQSFGFLFLAVAIAVFAADRSIKISNQIKENRESIAVLEEDEPDNIAIVEMEMQNKSLAKQRVSIIMGCVVFALLLVVLAFMTMM